MNGQKKFFPIKQGVACQLKWTWNTIGLYEGTSGCCHRVEKIPLTADTFDNFHNDDRWINQRKLMLSGEFPQQGCQYCGNIEKNGGVSDRLTHLKIPDLYPPELDIDPTALHVTPRILEVFLDNKCNMSCIYCDESNSSVIQNENQKFGHINLPTSKTDNLKVPRHPEFKQLTEKFFEYLLTNYSHLRKLNILGGEPFFQKSFDRLVEFLKINQNPDLELTVVTNLKVPRKKLEIFISDMRQLIIQKKIKRLDITVSLDCLGKEQEYVRYGMNLESFKNNFEFLVSQKWITLNVNSTITCLTIKTMPEMILYINSFLNQRKIFFTFGIVDGHPYLNPIIFGGNFFDSDFAAILNSMPETSVWEKNQKQYMEGIISYISTSTVDIEKIHDLIHYLDEIDKRRNLNWRDTFLWLDNYINNLK